MDHTVVCSSIAQCSIEVNVVQCSLVLKLIVEYIVVQCRVQWFTLHRRTVEYSAAEYRSYSDIVV